MTQSTFFDLSKHFLVTSAIALLLWNRYHSWYFSLSGFFDPRKYVLVTNKAFIFLHGWEYLIILFYLGKKLKEKMPGLTWALTLPYVFHLFIPLRPLGFARGFGGISLPTKSVGRSIRLCPELMLKGYPGR